MPARGDSPGHKHCESPRQPPRGPAPAARREEGGRAGRSAKARPLLNFAPVAVEPAERREGTHWRPPPGTSFGEKERGAHVPRASVRFVAPQNLLWEPPPAPAAGIPLPPAQGPPARPLPLVGATAPQSAFPGCRAARLGPRRPVAWVTRESAPRRLPLGTAAFRGAREPAGHLYAAPREERRPPVSPPRSSLWRPNRPAPPSVPAMKPNFTVRLRVFNLNCWGIPYLSKHRADRVKRLGDFLNMESFDLALLEEVWSEQDFQYLRQKLLPTYPAAHYFRSGIIGSGLCVFSKHPIQEFTQHVFTLNGYPYMIHHCDWFCGKAVGLLVLHLNGLVLNAYVTHLHAEYNRQKDIYLAHRVAQAWELAQFIHHTSKKADVVLLCGDLNLHPKDLGCRLLKEWTGLHDAYLETRDFKGSEEGCTMVPKNCYVKQQELGPFPLGIRIDYILYKAVSGLCISCKTLKTTTGHDPYSGPPFSDHEALMATLCVRHSPPQHNPSPTHGPAESSPLTSVLREAWAEVDQGMAQAHWWATMAGYAVGLGLLLLALLCALAAGGWNREAALLLWTPNVGLVLGAGVFYLFHVQEAKGLFKTRTELQHVLGRAREAQDLGPESQPALLLGQQEGDRAEEQ